MKNYLMVLITSVLFGCNYSPDNIYLSCNGYSNTLNVYGGNIEEKREPSILSVEIKRLDGLIERIYSKPLYSVQVGNILFDKSNLFEDKDKFIGHKERVTTSNKNQYEYKFNLDRNTNHLTHYDFSFSPKDKVKEISQITINFEGKCEKVKEKI
jgi:hypothetical protein